MPRNTLGLNTAKVDAKREAPPPSDSPYGAIVQRIKYINSEETESKGLVVEYVITEAADETLIGYEVSCFVNMKAHKNFPRESIARAVKTVFAGIIGSDSDEINWDGILDYIQLGGEDGEMLFADCPARVKVSPQRAKEGKEDKGYVNQYWSCDQDADPSAWDILEPRLAVMPEWDAEPEPAPKPAPRGLPPARRGPPVPVRR